MAAGGSLDDGVKFVMIKDCVCRGCSLCYRRQKGCEGCEIAVAECINCTENCK